MEQRTQRPAEVLQRLRGAENVLGKPTEDNSSKRRRVLDPREIVTRSSTLHNQVLHSTPFRVLDAAGLLQGSIYGTAETCLRQIVQDLESGVFPVPPKKLLAISSTVADVLASEYTAKEFSLFLVDGILTTAFRTPPLHVPSDGDDASNSSVAGRARPAVSDKFYAAVSRRYGQGGPFYKDLPLKIRVKLWRLRPCHFHDQLWSLVANTALPVTKLVHALQQDAFLDDVIALDPVIGLDLYTWLHNTMVGTGGHFAYDWRSIRLYVCVKQATPTISTRFDPVCWTEMFPHVASHMHTLARTVAALVDGSYVPPEQHNTDRVVAALVALARGTLAVTQTDSQGTEFVRHLLLTQPRWLRAVLCAYAAAMAGSAEQDIPPEGSADTLRELDRLLLAAFSTDASPLVPALVQKMMHVRSTDKLVQALKELVPHCVEVTVRGTCYPPADPPAQGVETVASRRHQRPYFADSAVSHLLLLVSAVSTRTDLWEQCVAVANAATAPATANGSTLHTVVRELMLSPTKDTASGTIVRLLTTHVCGQRNGEETMQLGHAPALRLVATDVLQWWCHDGVSGVGVGVVTPAAAEAVGAEVEDVWTRP
eukprot:m.449370 g.449370  ORF g.449370 m.449370 type:complete len:596 (-) comp21506_c0_seq1:385-2172(-)